MRAVQRGLASAPRKAQAAAPTAAGVSVHDGVGPRVAVCFYGLNRALHVTLPSIERFVLRPLFAAGAHVEIFYHTWSLVSLADTGRAGGERSAVRAIGGAREMAALLDPTGLVRGRGVSDQAAFDDAIRPNITAYARRDHRYAGANVRNLLRQLESLRRVGALWRAASAPYASILYVRPDMRFLDPIDAQQLFGLGGGEFLTPYWHRWSGLNDRIAGGRPRAAVAFAERGGRVDAYVAKAFLRAEAFLRWVMVDVHGLAVVDMAARAQRVRADGFTANNDVCLAYCAPTLKRTCRGDCRALVPANMTAPPLAAWAHRQQKRDHPEPAA